MKSVNQENLVSRIVTDRADIQKLRWFQYHRYLDAGLLSKALETLPQDPLVDVSTYFGVYQGEQIAATARLLCFEDLPLLAHHMITPEFQCRLDASKGCVAEISRFAVGTSGPRHRAITVLGRELIRFGIANRQASVLVASVERPMVRMLGQVFDMPVHVIGDEIAGYGDYNGACVPILIDVIECLRTYKDRGTRYWNYFSEDLVIDLTVEDRQSSLAG